MAVVAFVAATVIMPSQAFAAAPGAIPGSALPACAEDSAGGGWSQRDFASNGGSVDTEFEARVKGLRLNEPCVQTLSGSGPEISIPITVLDVYDDTVPGFDWGDSAPITSGEGTVPPGGDLWHPSPYNLRTTEGGGFVNNASKPGIYANGKGGLFQIGVPGASPAVGPNQVEIKWNSLSGGLNYFGLFYVCDTSGPTSNPYGYPKSSYTGEYFELSSKGASGSKVITLAGECGTLADNNDTMVNPTAKPRLVLLKDNGTNWDISTVLILGEPDSTLPGAGGDAGRTLNGQVAAEIAVDGQGIMAPARGYYVCANSAAGDATNNVQTIGIRIYDENYPDSMNDLGGADYDPSFSETWHAIQDQPCPYLKEIHVFVCYYVVSGDVKDHKCTEAVWTYALYASGNTYEGDLKDNACNAVLNGTAGGCTDVLYPDPFKPEPAIVCEIEYSDPSNPITNIGEFFGGLGPFVACLFTPQGWDRTNKITKVWESGPVGQMTDALTAAVPESIACGELVSLPLLEGQSMVLDTCVADFAPGGVKFVIGSVIILGTVVLIARRVLWAVGSSS